MIKVEMQKSLVKLFNICLKMGAKFSFTYSIIGNPKSINDNVMNYIDIINHSSSTKKYYI